MTGRRRGQLKKIAVTGGIGSGKSSLVRELSLLGYPIFDADLLLSDVVLVPTIQQRIVSLLGNDAYSSDDNGRVVYQRRWVREQVFSNPELRQHLEDITHPAIRDRFLNICRDLSALADGVWVFYEAALIFESNRENDFDAIVSVIAPEEVRRDRLIKSRVISEDVVSAIFSAQVSDQIRVSKSHFVIDNASNSDDLSNHALSLVENLRNFFHPKAH